MKPELHKPIFSIVKDVVLQFGLDMTNILGLYYNGVLKCSGHISGTQTQIKLVQ